MELHEKYFSLLANYLQMSSDVSIYSRVLQIARQVHSCGIHWRALVWNTLVRIYSWTRAEYTLMECARVERIHACGVH